MKFATIAITIADGPGTGQSVSVRMWPAPLMAAEHLAAQLTEVAGAPMEGISSMPSDEYTAQAMKELNAIILSPGEE